ncbi:hypothetical protein [Burkholderia cenocepacia]|uniref:hypothetical protein n=1 Tax=Burkholderia cenocepacia TaxID=95486 RepID=UPI00117878C9|nr:hypothetical protein [Burkholderia cenocepacia]
MNTAKAELSNKISIEYDLIVEELTMSLDWLNKSNDYTFLDSLKLSFTDNTYDKFLAQAIYSTSEIEFSLNGATARTFQATIIHEIAHHISFSYLGIRGHTLEFAIINYALYYKFNQDANTFFRSYDIAQDKAFPFLSINSFLFDTMVKNITFVDLTELSLKAVELAKSIRENSIPLNLSKTITYEDKNEQSPHLKVA